MDKAKIEASREALKMIKHPLYFKKNLIQIPLDTEKKSTATLILFFKKHSIFKENIFLEGYYSQRKNSKGGLTFTCKLKFQDILLDIGHSKTYNPILKEQTLKEKRGFQRQALERVSKKVLTFFKHTVEMPKKIYFDRLGIEAAENVLSNYLRKDLGKLFPIIRGYYGNLEYKDLQLRTEPQVKEDPNEKK